MKFMKYALISLIAAIIADAAMVFAYPSPIATGLVYELSMNNKVDTEWRTKNTWTAQTYENYRTFTWMTNPCPNCKISAKPVSAGGDLYVGVVTTEGQKKQFTDPTTISSPNDYMLKIWRVDITLLTTSHSAMWTMNAK